MSDENRRCRQAFSSRLFRAFALAVVGATPVVDGGVTLTQTSNTSWTVSNGSLTAVFDPESDNVTSVTFGTGGNTSPNLLSQLDEEFAGTPFGSGPTTFGSNVGPGNSYVDVWTSTASATNSSGGVTNPITYSFHYLVFANDPTIYCYEVLNHSATDPATSVGQGQFLFRSNPSLFPNLYQINTGPNQQGNGNAVTIANMPSTNPNFENVIGQAGRTVQNAAYDLTGSGIPGDNGTNFFTKYDYSIYTQFYQAETMYGSNYAVTEVDPTTDSLTGGPTKQELAWTDPGILNMEFLSGHYGTGGTNGSGPFPGYSYYPPQGVASSRLFGPYGFTVSSTVGTTAAAINQSVINSIPGEQAEFNTDTELTNSGYINTTTRGLVQVSNVANAAGWSSNSSNNTVVLSEPGVNFQESTQGYQYWGQMNQSGNVTITNVVPGTYRLSMYELGQWGETRVDGVQVEGNKIVLPQNLKFTPENFGTAPPIWTLGTPDRSSNEFLNGHNALGQDQRQFYGAYDYWAEEAALGNPGKVVYYATAVGNIPATNNTNDWIANQWGKFDPGLYDASNGTGDNYTNIAPAYVKAAGGPANYSGAPWEIHFTTTAAQQAQGQYVVLSVGLAAAEGSLIVGLNGHTEIWHVANSSDAMVRSGDAGFYQWLAYQFPTSDLNAPGADNEFTFSTSQPDGDMYDALRMEITNTSADPTTTGWYDYNWVTGENSQTAPVDSTGSTATNVYSGSSTWNLSTGGSWSPSTSWANYIIPGLVNDIATFGGSITAPGTVTLDGNRTVGGIVFNNPAASYTLAAGTNGSLTLSSTTGNASITDLAGAHIISAPILLASSTIVTATNTGDSITLSGGVSGSGNVTISGLGTVVMAGANTYTGSTTVLSGTLLIPFNASIASTALATSTGGVLKIQGAVPVNAMISGSGTTIFAAGTGAGIFQRTIGSLSLSSGGVVDVYAPALRANRTVLVTSGLSFAGGSNSWQGSIDLADNDMIVHGGNLVQITNQIQAGFAGGEWNGTDGITSTTAAADTTHLTVLAPIQSVGNTFDGIATTPSDILVKYTYYGDANLDGKVDGSDYNRIDYGFLSGATGWYNGDFNFDGVVNASDYTLIDNAYQHQGAILALEVGNPTVALASQIAGPSVAVPEPSCMVLGLVAALGLPRRRQARGKTLERD